MVKVLIITGESHYHTIYIIINILFQMDFVAFCKKAIWDSHHSYPIGKTGIGPSSRNVTTRATPSHQIGLCLGRKPLNVTKWRSLLRLEVSEEAHGQQFWVKKETDVLFPCRLGQLLWDKATKWLHPKERLPEEFLEQVSLEQFVCDLEGGVKDWVRRHQPKTLEEAIKSVEDFLVAEKESGQENQGCQARGRPQP